MKGQLSIPSDTMMDALGFIFITATLVLTLIAFTEYQISYETKPELRQVIDYAENFISSKCIVYEDNGIFYKGILDKTKLDGGIKSCIQTDKPVFVHITDQKNGNWGQSKPISKEKIVYPVIIKYPNEFVIARMEVTI